jgi:hypothetical protein
MKKQITIELDGKKYKAEILEEVKESQYSRKRLEEYWYYNPACGVVLTGEDQCGFDGNNFAIGNYFATEEEAEAYKNKLILTHRIKDRIAELNEGWNPDWKSFNKEKYYICIYCGKLDVSFAYLRNIVESWKYIKSRALAEQLISEFGDDLKVLFE